MTDHIAGRKCALYNELSHMTPYYLHHASPEEINAKSEAIFHLNNIKLLCLYFDKIFIPIENILSFANRRNMLVVQQVVTSDQFKQLLELGIVNLCGWGANDSGTMLEKGFSYATKEYAHLKEDKYLKRVESIARINPLVTRDSSRFDIGHDRFLLETLSLLDNPIYRSNLENGAGFVRQFYNSYSYIGSLEFYKWMDSNNLAEDLSSAFYKSYYRAWQDYCYQNYAPVITVNSERIRYSYGEINIGSEDNPVFVKAMLYSPAIFMRFLDWQLGRDVSRKLIRLSPTNIQTIRNGDGAWHRFKDKYHSCVEASSDIFDLEKEVWHLRHELDEESTKLILNSLFENRIHKLGRSGIVDIISLLSLPLSWLAHVFNPAAILAFVLSHLFKKTASAPFSKEAVPFYKKANYLARSAAAMPAV
ncbi:hypothetical protein [Breoghania sp. L-A4]|uniref:hypothetical protein n=1 Tax=Breoghania sp. L-A4 TaxID=2304600 RepID=UPI0013C33FA0|nr:hypothetical protein [Breoghania sp. L-A4]